jgi:hypothetical protein
MFPLFFALKYLLLLLQNICHCLFVNQTGHFVRMIQLIFEADVEYGCKDIIFFTPYTGLVIPRVNISLDTSFMPSYTYLFAVCH